MIIKTMNGDRVYSNAIAGYLLGENGDGTCDPKIIMNHGLEVMLFKKETVSSVELTNRILNILCNLVYSKETDTYGFDFDSKMKSGLTNYNISMAYNKGDIIVYTDGRIVEVQDDDPDGMMLELDIWTGERFRILNIEVLFKILKYKYNMNLLGEE